MTVREFLTQHGLSAYADAFEAQHVGVADLVHLSDEDLQADFGMLAYVDRKRFKAAVASLLTPAPLSGATRFESVPPAPLSGATRFESVPPAPLSGATRADTPPSVRGLTMMGKAVSVTSVDLGALQPGTSFDGRYTIVDLLGRGGMGAVYQAVDTRVKQTVALKTLPSNDPVLLDALAREVALAQELNHANLLGVRHLETRGEAPYLVMELMDGGDLAEHLASAGGKLEEAEAKRILDGVLSGLAGLHAARVAHLDVKPSNVLLGRDGRVKLADFGISSRMRDQRQGGAGAGTPEYAPPEQLRGDPCDARADVYAAGMLAHVLLTGRLPFDGHTVADARRWHASGSRSFPLLAPGVAQVLAKATAPEADARYRSAEELRTALGGALTQRSWYPLAEGTAVSLRGKVADQVRLLGAKGTVSLGQALLDRGAALPGWETAAGQVVLSAHPLAALFGGAKVGASGAALQAGSAALGGAFEALAALKEEDVVTEAALALAASIGGDANLALRRLAFAEAGAKTTEQQLSVALALRALGGAADAEREARGRAERAAKSVEDQLAVAASARWVFGDRQGCARALLAAERLATRAEDHFAVAQAQLSLAGDARAVSAALARYAEASGHSAAALVLAAEVLGAQPALRAWAERLEQEAGADAEKLEGARSAWSALGDAGSAARSASARTHSLDHQFGLLVERLAAVGVARVRPSAALTPEGLRTLSAEVEAQESWHRAALALDVRAQKVGLSLATMGPWVRPFSAAALGQRKQQVEVQEALDRAAQELDASYARLGLDGRTWVRPITESAVQDARSDLEPFEALIVELEALCASCSAELGWAPAVPLMAGAFARASLTDASGIEAFRRVVAEQQGFKVAVDALRAGCTAKMTWAPPAPVFPMDAEKVGVLKDEVGRQIAWHVRVKGAGLGGRRPFPPYDEAAVAKYEQACAAYRRQVKLLGAALGLVALLGVGFVIWVDRAAEAARVARVEAAEDQRLAETARAAALTAALESQQFVSPTLGTMKWIPPGTFMMGSPETEAGRSPDETQHSVTLTKGYWLMEHEVTQGEWQAVMGSNPSNFTACGPTCPVEQVSWNDAVAFAQQASARDGVTYALPTEAQWEYAARGGQDTLYAGSNEATATGWIGDNSGSTTHAVCGLARNAYGLCDMSGNVWEWTSDWYGDYGGNATDPTGASTGSARVSRGGSWGSDASLARVAVRNYNGPAFAINFIGFRLSRSNP